MRPAARPLDAVKAFEDVGQFPAGDAGPGIANRQHGGAVALAQANGHRSVEGELDRVRDQVQDDLFPHVAVDPDRVRQGLALDDETQAAPLTGGAERAGKVRRQLGEIGRFEPRPHPARLDP